MQGLESWAWLPKFEGSSAGFFYYAKGSSIPWSFLTTEIPWCFECFRLFFLCFSRGFSGVERGKNPWCFGWFSLVFT